MTEVRTSYGLHCLTLDAVVFFEEVIPISRTCAIVVRNAVPLPSR